MTKYNQLGAAVRKKLDLHMVFEWKKNETWSYRA